MANDIVTQPTPEKQSPVLYDGYGWPINPATGEAYSADELAADATLPLPRDPQAQQFIERKRARAAGQAPEPKAKCKRRRSSPPRRQMQSTIRLIPFSSAERQTLLRYDSTADLVERVNEPASREIPLYKNDKLVKMMEVSHR